MTVPFIGLLKTEKFWRYLMIILMILDVLDVMMEPYSLILM